MNEKREPPLTMTIGEYHWKRGSDGRYVMHDGFSGSRYQCGVTESLLVERLAKSQAELGRLRLTDEELENIDLAIQQLPYGAAREKVVLYEIMQRYGFQRDRSGGTQGR